LPGSCRNTLAAVGMTSIERTAYPRFKCVVAARDLREAFTPTTEETIWARGLARTPPHLLSLVVLLKSFQRLGYFPRALSFLRDDRLSRC
jgi:hypothetical protein